jgi:hypothetical protein
MSRDLYVVPILQIEGVRHHTKCCYVESLPFFQIIIGVSIEVDYDDKVDVFTVFLIFEVKLEFIDE